jgi:hypothetical protein
MRVWIKKDGIWCLGEEAMIKKISERWYALVLPHRQYHLGPYRTLDKAMKSVSQFLLERDHIPFCR